MPENLPDRKCRKCGSTKPITDFPHNKHGPDGVDKMCKACWKNRATKTFIGSGNSKTNAVIVPVVIKSDVPVVVLKRLADLPRDPMWGWDGEFNLGLETYAARTNLQPTVVYRFAATNKFFAPLPIKENANESLPGLQ